MTLTSKAVADLATEGSARLDIVKKLRIETLEKIRIDHCGIDVGTQSKRLLMAMQRLDGVSTIEAVRYLDILHPPARKLNLIEAGHIVNLVWVYELSSCGKIHRVGKYVYAGKASYPLFDNLDGWCAA